MDVWVVAAAAGAGYVVQLLKNLRKRNSFDLSSGNYSFDRPDSSGDALAMQESLGQEPYWRRKLACNDASTSGAEGDSVVMMDDSMVGDVDDSNYSAERLNNEDNEQGDWEDRVPSNTSVVLTSDSVPQTSRDFGFCNGFGRNKSSPRWRKIRSKAMKPRTSLESCLMAQLFMEHAKFEEYICSLHTPLQKPCLRPFNVTDESRIISRTPHESCGKLTETINLEVCKKTNLEENKSVVGIPRLPNVVPMELWKRTKVETGTEQVSARSNATLVTSNQNNAHGGLSDSALQFYVGLTMGIIYSFVASKWEMDKLRKSLAQTQNLVQDLQEELEMKDTLTMNELAVENHESQDMQNDSHIDDSGQALSREEQDHSLRNCNEQRGDQIADEESMRRIEAELEAELDMLETNMNSSHFKGQMSSLAKLVPNFVVSDVIQGELRADLFGVKASAADEDGSNLSTPRYAQYPVSPKELSLRLHEVKQSRLEERIRELEMALEHSQEKLKSFESHCLHSPSDFPKTGTSSNYESLAIRDGELHSIDQPVIINLSRGTPAAYNDTYEEEESPKLSQSDEEEMFHRNSRDSVWKGGLNGQMRQGWISSGSQEMAMSNNNNSNDNDGHDGLFSSSRDDESAEEEDEDEMEKLLIRQIVEKARQGSPAAALLKAQRTLLSTDL